jgi:hypothetical protein
MLRIPAYVPPCSGGEDRSLWVEWLLATPHTHGADPGKHPRALLEAELASWEGTPHRAGQRRKGDGVDCTHFVAAVLEWVYARAGFSFSLAEAGPLPRSAQDLGVHTDCLEGINDAHSGAAGWFARRFPLRVVHGVAVGLEHCIPLDLVAINVAGGANHLAIVGDCRPSARGVKRGDLWHASGGAGGVVSRASLADAAMRRRVRMVFRPCVTGGSSTS